MWESCAGGRQRGMWERKRPEHTEAVFGWGVKAAGMWEAAQAADKEGCGCGSRPEIRFWNLEKIESSGISS